MTLTQALKSKRATHAIRLSAAAMVWLLLSIQTGCQSGANVYMTTSVPVPLVDVLPLRIGVFLPPELKNYEYKEKIANHGEFSVNLGDTQSQLFEQVFRAMFADVKLLDAPEELPEGLDGVLIPMVNQVQITIPQQMRSDFYEVWISYSIELKGPQGKHLHSWSFAAYGKANRRNYNNILDRADSALEHATADALRDVAGIILFSFTKQAPIQDWLKDV